ncbi:MAG: patatin-like phospholipase family protein [Thermoleophilaceae bacterium]
MTSYSHHPVAFVLSGGASLGAIQAGMLRALYERGIAPDMIVGTSAGALNGAFIASRPQTVETADALADVWRGLRRGEVFPINPLTGLLGFAGARAHLVPSSGLRRIIARNIDERAELLEELPIPLHVVAVDVVTGEELRLSDGPTADAVLASAAIPAVLSPVAFGGRDLMDGGVANNTPISHAIELGAKKLYVLPAGHACALEAPPRGALAMALHAISLLMHRRLVDDIEKHRDDAHLVVLPPPCPLAVQPIDFSHADELIERSLSDAREFLDRGGADRPPIRMRMHPHDQRTRKRARPASPNTPVTARARTVAR